MVSSGHLVQYRCMPNRAIFTPGRNWVVNQLESNETDALGTVPELAFSNRRELYCVAYAHGD